MAAPARKKIGTYEILAELARGGMGVVYLVEQPGLDRRAVLKALRRDLGGSSEMEERFRREARAAARVQHQNVVGVYDCFTWRGELFISQEYVDGADLSALLQQVGQLEPRVAGLIALEVVRGLEEIHSMGILHRDLKPANILIGREGVVKIADFGIALDREGPALTQIGYSVGTPPYMSPEQLVGDFVDARSDLFSLGAVIYESLTGQAAFAAGDDASLIDRVHGGRYASIRKAAPGTPRALARLVRACLRPRPRRRPQTSTAIRRALERQLGSPSSASARREIASWLRQRRVFGVDAGETVLAETRAPTWQRWSRPARWALAAVLVAAAVAGSLIIDLRDLSKVSLPATLRTTADTDR